MYALRYPEVCVIIFAKAPRPGKVKTRLFPALSASQAASLQRRLIFETLEMSHDRKLCPVQLWCSPSTEHPDFLEASTRFPISLHTQSGADLGERMDNAFSANLSRFAAAILIGCDSPSITSEDLHSGISALKQDTDVVLGPAEDGGYVLIGMKRRHPELFRNMPWGSAEVLSETRARIRKLGLRSFETGPQWDLDRPDDLDRYRVLKGL